MKKTKKLTLSAMLAALSTLFMVLGAVIEVLDLSAAALASLMVAFAYIELGSPYTWLVWICTSLLSAILYPGSLMWAAYLFLFGLYPIVKGYIERTKRIFWWGLKMAFAIPTLILVGVLSELLLGLPLVSESVLSSINGFVIYALLLLVGVVAFVAFDFFLTVLVRYYMERIRPRIKSLLK